MIQTIAGNGDEGYYGDGGPANLAALDSPSDVAFDASGRLLITDSENHVVRRVSRDGTIWTVSEFLR